MQRSNTLTSSYSSSVMQKGEQNAQPGSRTFFEKSKAGKEARATYLKIYIGGTFAVILMLFTVFPIYWGSLWKIPAHNLQGWVVDFDGGLIGQTVSQAVASNQGPSKVTWTLVAASTFPGGSEELANAVRHEDIWTAISINAGSSARLMAALTTPDPSYNGSQAITAYGVEARNENAYRNLIRTSIQGTLDAVTRKVSQEVARSAANSTALASVMAASPQTIVTSVYYTLDNLIPFDQPVASASTFVGMLYQLIMGFFVVMVALGAREASGYEKTLSTRHLIFLRFSSSFLAYFFISLFYSLLNLAFQLDVTRTFGRAGFLVFWMVNYVGMLAVCLALESLVTLLTTRGIPFFMLTWIITNLSVSIFPLEVLPRIFHYGHAAPFFNTSRALRTIVFGTRNRVGESVGVLFVWIAISCITLPLIQWFVRRTPSESKDVKNRNLDSEQQLEGDEITVEPRYEQSRSEKGGINLALGPENESSP